MFSVVGVCHSCVRPDAVGDRQTSVSPLPVSLLMLISGFRLWVILAPLNSPTKSPFGGKSCNKKSQTERETATDGRREGSLLWKCDAKHFQVNGNIGGVEKMGDEKGGGHG